MQNLWCAVLTSNQHIWSNDYQWPVTRGIIKCEWIAKADNCQTYQMRSVNSLASPPWPMQLRTNGLLTGALTLEPKGRMRSDGCSLPVDLEWRSDTLADELPPSAVVEVDFCVCIWPVKCEMSRRSQWRRSMNEVWSFLWPWCPHVHVFGWVVFVGNHVAYTLCRWWWLSRWFWVSLRVEMMMRKRSPDGDKK